MKTFRFPLQRVLEWRALQLRVEEEKLAGLQQQLVSLLQLREKLAAERNRSQSQFVRLRHGRRIGLADPGRSIRRAW